MRASSGQRQTRRLRHLACPCSARHLLGPKPWPTARGWCWPVLQTAGLFLHADTDFAAPFVDALGLATAQGPTGPYLKVGGFNVTSRAGIFAAGDITRPAGILTPALSDGVVTGTASHQSLLWPERFPPLQET